MLYFFFPLLLSPCEIHGFYFIIHFIYKIKYFSVFFFYVEKESDRTERTKKIDKYFIIPNKICKIIKFGEMVFGSCNNEVMKEKFCALLRAT